MQQGAHENQNPEAETTKCTKDSNVIGYVDKKIITQPQKLKVVYIPQKQDSDKTVGQRFPQFLQ